MTPCELPEGMLSQLPQHSLPVLERVGPSVWLLNLSPMVNTRCAIQIPLQKGRSNVPAAGHAAGKQPSALGPLWRLTTLVEDSPCTWLLNNAGTEKSRPLSPTRDHPEELSQPQLWLPRGYAKVQPLLLPNPHSKRAPWEISCPPISTCDNPLSETSDHVLGTRISSGK